MTAEVTPLHVVVEDARSDSVSAFRDRLALRSAEHAHAEPQALVLEAKVLRGIHSQLHGVATHLRGLHSPQRFRAALMGERHFPLSDLCRLTVNRTREARGASKAAVAELATALGYRLEPLHGTTVEAHEAQAAVIESAAALTAELGRDLGDGRLTPEEARALRPEIDAHKAHVAQLEAVITGAERGGRL